MVIIKCLQTIFNTFKHDGRRLNCLSLTTSLHVVACRRGGRRLTTLGQTVFSTLSLAIDGVAPKADIPETMKAVCASDAVIGNTPAPYCISHPIPPQAFDWAEKSWEPNPPAWSMENGLYENKAAHLQWEDAKQRGHVLVVGQLVTRHVQ